MKIKPSHVIWLRLILPLVFSVGSALALFGPALWQHSTIVPAAEILQRDQLYKQEHNQVQGLPTNKLLFDLGFQIYPWTVFTQHNIRQGNIPWWNPYISAGVPFLANPQTSVFEFTQLLAALIHLPAQQKQLFTSILTVIMAALFTYALARAYRFHYLAAAGSSMAFALSGPMLVWLGYPLTTVIMWLPAMLLCLHQLIMQRRWYWWIGLMVTTAWQWFGGNPEISFLVMLVGVLYAATLLQSRFSWQTAALVISGLLAGTVIALPQLIPAYLYIMQSQAAEIGRSGVANVSLWTAVQSGEWLGWNSIAALQQWVSEMVPLLVPNFFGNPALGQYWNWKYTNYSESAIYIGTFFLAAAAFGYKHAWTAKYRPLVFWCVAVVIAAGIIWHWPGFNLIQYLPVLKLISLDRLRLIITFGLALLAGYGLDCFLREAGARRWHLMMVIVGCAAASGISGLLWQWFVRPFPTQKFWLTEVVWLLWWMGVATIVWWMREKLDHWPRASLHIMTLCVGIAVFQLGWYGWQYHPSFPVASLTPTTPAHIFLQNHLGRYRLTNFHLPSGDFTTAMVPNLSSIWSLADVRGYEVVLPRRYQMLVNAYAGDDPRIEYREYNQTYFDLLGVKYFIQAGGGEDTAVVAERADNQLVYRDEVVKIFENMSVMPRAYISYATTVVPDATAALAVLRSPDFDPRSTTLVERRAASDPTTALVSDRALEPATITRYEPTTVELELDAKAPAVVVLTDSYYEAWSATVDGVPTSIMPANVAFRAVSVMPGHHIIRYQYQWP